MISRIGRIIFMSPFSPGGRSPPGWDVGWMFASKFNQRDRLKTMREEMPSEACGIVGVFGHPEAAKLTYLGLYMLQHRGQESAGIVSSGGGRLNCYRARGRVSEVFNRARLD